MLMIIIKSKQSFLLFLGKVGNKLQLIFRKIFTKSFANGRAGRLAAKSPRESLPGRGGSRPGPSHHPLGDRGAGQ